MPLSFTETRFVYEAVGGVLDLNSLLKDWVNVGENNKFVGVVNSWILLSCIIFMRQSKFTSSYETPDVAFHSTTPTS